MSSGGSTRPLPKSCAQTQLLMARAKYGLSGAVIQSASALRGSSAGATFTTLPSRSRGSTGFLVRRWMTSPFGLMVTFSRPIIIPAPAPPRWTLAKNDGQAVIGVLGPDVEGVIVALGASHPETQEPLSRQLGLFVRHQGIEGVIDRPAVVEVVGVAHGSQERPDHLIPGPILGQAFSIQVW